MSNIDKLASLLGTENDLDPIERDNLIGRACSIICKVREYAQIAPIDIKRPDQIQQDLLKIIESR